MQTFSICNAAVSLLFKIPIDSLLCLLYSVPRIMPGKVSALYNSHSDRGDGQ